MVGVAIIAFLAGLAVGSFATAAAYRLPRAMKTRKRKAVFRFKDITEDPVKRRFIVVPTAG